MKVRRSPRRVAGLEPLHAEATSVALPGGASSGPTVHTHLEEDLPTVTDVALVLRNPNLAPHLILTPRHIFRIDAEGVISYLGSNQPLAEGE